MEEDESDCGPGGGGVLGGQETQKEATERRALEQTQ